MRRQALWGLLALAAAVPVVGCSEDEPINQVGVNVVEKSLFDGSWYMARTVISTDYESSSFGTFTGDSAYDYATGGFSVPRIRWVIDEHFLYGYRDVPLIQGANADEADPNFRGQPVAAFKILSHFDIRNAYDSVTGQERNVIVEESSDRRWYERRYMRVDWTQNHVVSYQYLGSEIYELLGFWHRESAPLWVGPGSDFPAAWLPSFDFMTCSNPGDTSANCRQQDRDFAGDYAAGQLYHMSFVTQEIHSPGQVPDPYTGAPVPFCMSPYSDAPSCNTATVMVRTSFLRVSGHDYEPINWTDSRFDRFGYFRNEMPTYDRSVGTPDDYQHGRTDYMNYTASRQNIWRQVWQRDASGQILRDDLGRPIPMAHTDRQVRQVVWHTTPDAPAHLIKPVMKLTSDWNLVYMQMVRRLRGQDVPEYEAVSCQESDPSGHCYCIRDAEGEVLNPTCPGVYDPFETVEAQSARITNGAAPYNCFVEVPAGAEPDEAGDWTTVTDSSFDGWFQSGFRGDECVTVTRVNSCNRAAMRAWEAAGSDPATRPLCQERGDLRYKFLAYIDEPGTPFLGVATLRSDPITGETITGDANIGGPALDSSRTRYMYFYDLLRGNISELEFIYGEDIRSYFESLNYVEQPAVPQVDFLAALDPSTPVGQQAFQRLSSRFDQVLARTEPLRQPDGSAQTFEHLMENLRGTDIEQRLTDNPETWALAGLQRAPEGQQGMPEELLDRASPLRVNVRDHLSNHREVLERANFYGIEFQIDEYSDESVLRFIEQRQTWPRERVMFEINRAVYEGTQLHEMGHCLGLRHDFGGTADTEHYLDGYYQINERIPFPRVPDFDTDGVLGLSATEQQAFENAYETAVQQRARAGIYRFMNSSIMDYTADFGQRTGEVLGLYDQAAVTFGYGDLVEVAHNTSGLPRRQINPTNTPRLWWRWYQGGESCNSDSDCPYSGSGTRSAELINGQTVTQRCSPNELSPDGGGICSNFDEDLALLGGTNPDSTAEYQPVLYRFCSDGEVGRIGWCHRFDNGDSYREIVRYAREQYDRYYLFNAFRRYRASFDYQTYFASVFRQYDILEAMFNSMFWQYVSGDRTYSAPEGAFGFADHYASTVDSMNFFVRVLSQPSVGTYAWDPGWRRYERISSYETSGAFYMGLGQAKYDYTIYQRGLTGINRLERIGILYDRIFALQLLALRGGGYFRRDLPFLVNYYDLFPAEMQQLFNGMIRDDPTNYAPRLDCGGATGNDCTDPRIVYMDIYRGDCSDPESAACRPNPVTETYASMPPVNAGVSILAQIYGAMFGLSSFPTYYDSTFQRQLFVCIEGQGNCNSPPAGAVEGTDFARYRSARFGKTYLAFNVQSSIAGQAENSIGFQMVQEAANLAFMIEAIQYVDRGEAIPAALQAELTRIDYVVPSDDNVRANDLSRLDGRLRDVEGFFTQLLQIENEMGIISVLRF